MQGPDWAAAANENKRKDYSVQGKFRVMEHLSAKECARIINRAAGYRATVPNQHFSANEVPAKFRG